MRDEEVESCEATSYQIAVIIAATLHFIRNSLLEVEDDKKRVAR